MTRLRATLDPAHARFAAACLAALALFVGTYLAFVGTDIGQTAENLAVRGAELRTDATRNASLDQLTPISVVTFTLAILAVIGVGALRRRPGLGVLAGAAMGVSVVLAELLKEVLPRPMLVDGAAWLTRNTFPSGSAAVAMAIAVGAVLVVPDRTRWLAVAAGAPFAAVIVNAIQVAGWHRLSDTIGGVLLVVAVAAAGVAAMALAGLVQPSRSGRVHRRIHTILVAIGVTLIAVGLLMVVLLVTFPILTSPVGGRRAFLQAAFPLLGAGLTIFVLVAFTRLIEPFSLGTSTPAARDVPVDLDMGPPEVDGAFEPSPAEDRPAERASLTDQHRRDAQP
jgi:hypothetical protein